MEHLEVLKAFPFEGTFVKHQRYGSGHINGTYVFVFHEEEDLYRRYLIQKINDKVFKDIDGLMSNIAKVTNVLRTEIIKNGGDPDRESLTLLYTNDNKPYFKSKNNGYYRVYYFVEEGLGYDITTNPDHFYESGKAFGKFQKQLDGFNIDEIVEVIPNFHNTVDRFNKLETAINNDSVQRLKDVSAEVDFFKARKPYASRVVDKLNDGSIPYRVTHNDTKLNNVLINPNTNKALCVIDLDTIMPGSALYDFGDSIRFGASTALEDEKDLSKVNFDISLFEIYTKGFLSETANTLNKEEVDNLAFSAILMTYECGMRFLTDHLEGDVYFRTTRQNHNLDRARTQIKLVAEMEKVLDEMDKIVQKYYQQFSK